MAGKVHKPRGVSRRLVLQAGAMAGLLSSPAVIRASALASSGNLNLLGWSGYRFDDLFAAFTRATGITVNFADEPDHAGLQAKAKAALQGGGIDIVEPTLDRVRAWIADGLVQPWDLTKITLDTYEPALVTGAAGEAAQHDGRRYFLPSVWGTEGLTRSDKDAGEASSLADLFDPKFKGKVAVRAHSGLAALGRVLDAEAKLPKPFLDSYKNPETMRLVWDVVLAEAIQRKSAAQFWSGENEAEAAFRTGGCRLGLTWDTTGFALARGGQPVTFVAPKEGAFGWLQGYVLHAKAANVEQAVAFANFCSGPEGSALVAAAFSANPAGRGAIDHMAPEFAKFYRTAYPGDALSRLWWWPPQESWFLKLRGEYAEKWRAA